MNDEMLRRLAEEIAKQTIINNWPFYLIILACSFIGTTVGSYLKARMTKRGEIAATKADTREILNQLSKTTATAKSVELSLSRGDWILREKNSLRRTKLEQLIIAAYALSEWIDADNMRALRGEPPTSELPISNFTMLSTLYFPEFKEAAKKIEDMYQVTMIQSAPVRIQIRDLTALSEEYRHNGRTEFFESTISRRSRLQDREQPKFVVRSMALHKAVEELAEAAHELMEQLTAPVGHSN